MEIMKDTFYLNKKFFKKGRKGERTTPNSFTWFLGKDLLGFGEHEPVNAVFLELKIYHHRNVKILFNSSLVQQYIHHLQSVEQFSKLTVSRLRHSSKTLSFTALSAGPKLGRSSHKYKFIPIT